MRRRSSLFFHAYFSLLCALLFACSSTQAGQLRFGVNFDGEEIGYLVFEVEMDDVNAGQNVWGSLVDWAFRVDDVYLNSSNSIPATDTLFIVHPGEIEDGYHSWYRSCSFPFCPPQLTWGYNPKFDGYDGTQIEFFSGYTAEEDYYYSLWPDGCGLVAVTDASGVENRRCETFTYSGPSALPAAVIDPAILWLLLQR